MLHSCGGLQVVEPVFREELLGGAWGGPVRSKEPASSSKPSKPSKPSGREASGSGSGAE